MSSLILSTESSEGYTSVSNIFISEYVPGANGEFVKVYLYLLHLMSLRSNNISISLLADTFNQTEADIMRALRYWDSLDVISPLMVPATACPTLYFVILSTLGKLLMLWLTQ